MFRAIRRIPKENSKVKNLFLIFVLILTIKSNAEEGKTKIEIKGAFGIKFTQSYPQKQASPQSNYKIDPIKEPYRKFTNYIFSITPITQKPYLIRANYLAINEDEAIKEFDILKKILETKYQTKLLKIESIPKNQNETFIIQHTKTQRHILIIKADKQITIIYKDTQLQKIAKEEKLKLEIKQTNSNAL